VQNVTSDMVGGRPGTPGVYKGFESPQGELKGLSVRDKRDLFWSSVK
jgi:hypothetical protein